MDKFTSSRVKENPENNSSETYTSPPSYYEAQNQQGLAPPAESPETINQNPYGLSPSHFPHPSAPVSPQIKYPASPRIQPTHHPSTPSNRQTQFSASLRVQQSQPSDNLRDDESETDHKLSPETELNPVIQLPQGSSLGIESQQIYGPALQQPLYPPSLDMVSQYPNGMQYPYGPNLPANPYGPNLPANPYGPNLHPNPYGPRIQGYGQWPLGSWTRANVRILRIFMIVAFGIFLLTIIMGVTFHQQYKKKVEKYYR